MFVYNRMSSPAVTITPDAVFHDALKLMHDHRVRRLPVVDESGKLVGIVSERDLLYPSPSCAGAPSVWELNYKQVPMLFPNPLCVLRVLSQPMDVPGEESA